MQKIPLKVRKMVQRIKGVNCFNSFISKSHLTRFSVKDCQYFQRIQIITVEIKCKAGVVFSKIILAKL